MVAQQCSNAWRIFSPMSRRLGKQLAQSSGIGWRDSSSTRYGCEMIRSWLLDHDPNLDLSLRYQRNVTEEVCLATPRGFEPPISSVTSWYVRPLHHGAAYATDGRSSIQTLF